MGKGHHSKQRHTAPPPGGLSKLLSTMLAACNIQDNMYRYMGDRLALDSHTHSENPGLPSHLSQVVTPVWVEEWRRELASYPDARLVSNLSHMAFE